MPPRLAVPTIRGVPLERKPPYEAGEPDFWRGERTYGHKTHESMRLTELIAAGDLRNGLEGENTVKVQWMRKIERIERALWQGDQTLDVPEVGVNTYDRPIFVICSNFSGSGRLISTLPLFVSSEVWLARGDDTSISLLLHSAAIRPRIAEAQIRKLLRHPEINSWLEASLKAAERR